MIQFSSSTFECQVLPEERSACAAKPVYQEKKREKKNRKEKGWKQEQKKNSWPKEIIYLFMMTMQLREALSPDKERQKGGSSILRI